MRIDTCVKGAVLVYIGRLPSYNHVTLFAIQQTKLGDLPATTTGW